MKATIANFQFVVNLLATNIKPIEKISESCNEQIELLKSSIENEKDKDIIYLLFEEKKRIVKVFTALEYLLTQGNNLLQIMVKWDDSEQPNVFDRAKRKSYEMSETNHYKAILPSAIDGDDLPKAYTYLESLLELLQSALHEKFINTVIGKSQAEIFLQDLKIEIAKDKLTVNLDEKVQANLTKLSIFKAETAHAAASEALLSIAPK